MGRFYMMDLMYGLLGTLANFWQQPLQLNLCSWVVVSWIGSVGRKWERWPIFGSNHCT